MAITIEHMEMPNGCCACRMERENCCTLSLRKIDDIYDRPEWCLLTESEPIKHGRWIEHHEPFSWMGYTTWTCSKCDYEVGYEKDIKNITNYCPDCGAKMDAPNNAYWIKQLNGEYKCSVCGDTTLAPLYKCSTCGARMDEVVEE